MFFDYPLLSLVVWLPILGGIAVLLNGDNSYTRPLSLTVALVTLYLSTWLYMGFDMATSDMQFVEYLPWISAYSLSLGDRWFFDAVNHSHRIFYCDSCNSWLGSNSG